jgi:threonine synthase
MAKKMGLPIGMLCAGVNENDITHRTFQTGKFHKSSTMKKTLSDAINIQIVSRIYRFFCVKQLSVLQSGSIGSMHI